MVTLGQHVILRSKMPNLRVPASGEPWAARGRRSGKVAVSTGISLLFLFRPTTSTDGAESPSDWAAERTVCGGGYWPRPDRTATFLALGMGFWTHAAVRYRRKHGLICTFAPIRVLPLQPWRCRWSRPFQVRRSVVSSSKPLLYRAWRRLHRDAEVVTARSAW